MDDGWVVPGQRRESPLAEGLRQLRCALTVVRTSAAVLSDDDCRDGVRELASLVAETEATWLGLVADLDGRPDAVPGAVPGHVGRAFLTGGLNRSHAQARRDEAAARAPGDLPQVAEAFAAGDVHREQADACVAIVAKLPKKILDTVDETGRSARRRIDAYLAEQAKVYDAQALKNLGRQLIAVLDPTEESFDPDRYLKRYLRLTDSPDGMTTGRFALDQAGAAFVKAALAHFGKPGTTATAQPVDGQEAMQITDERSRSQRDADALVAIARLACAADPSTTRREPPHVLVTPPRSNSPTCTRAVSSWSRSCRRPSGGRPARRKHHGAGRSARPRLRCCPATASCRPSSSTRTAVPCSTSAASSAPPRGHNAGHSPSETEAA